MTKYTTEQEFLTNYNPNDFARPSTTVDNVIYSVIDDALHVLLVKRENHPFQGQWSLVGGFVDLETDDDLEATAKRKLEEKTGVKTPYLEQFYTKGNKTRDPRCWSITTVYFALISSVGIELNIGKGATDIQWFKVADGSVQADLAFDHADILRECTQRLQNKVLYTSLPLYLMPEHFTLSELQTIYETILGNSIVTKAFRRRMLGADIIEETGEMKQTGRRPAALYRCKPDAKTHFFVRNLEGSHER